MPAASLSAVRKQIQSGAPAPVYLLTGDDEIEKAALAHEFEELVDEGLRAFNVDRLHAGDWTSGDRLAAGIGALIAAARTLPMMSPVRVVIVLRAEVMLAPRRESEAGNRAIEQLERFFKAPEPQTALVLVAGDLDGRSRMSKLLSKEATVVECGVIENPADAERWVRNRVVAAGMQIDPPAARLLAERGGTDLRRLRNDVDRLVLYALGQKSVTLDDVRQMAGPAALQDDWALPNAIESGNAADALRQLALTVDAGAPPEKILGQLRWIVETKLPGGPAGLPRAVELLVRTDLGLKRSAGDARVLLERLVVELCGTRRGGYERAATRPASRDL